MKVKIKLDAFKQNFGYVNKTSHMIFSINIRDQNLPN